MTNKTTNYQLNQWEPEDNFLRTDFNEDNAKIEAALSALAAGQVQIVTGTYTGNGDTAGREIRVGFRPKAVLLANNQGATNNGNTFGGIILDGLNLVTYNKTLAAQITDNGFTVYYNTDARSLTNQGNSVYYYLAFRW